jgi:hypothetical protein
MVLVIIIIIIIIIITITITVIINTKALVIIQSAGIMTAMRISCVVYAIPSHIMVYEMLGVSGFSKYGTFNLKVKISWNAGNVQDL